MPRLVGKQSNNELLAGLVLVAAIGVGAVGAEYYGYVNVVPHWGSVQGTSNLSVKPSLSETQSTHK